MGTQHAPAPRPTPFGATRPRRRERPSPSATWRVAPQPLFELKKHVKPIAHTRISKMNSPRCTKFRAYLRRQSRRACAATIAPPRVPAFAPGRPRRTRVYRSQARARRLCVKSANDSSVQSPVTLTEIKVKIKRSSPRHAAYADATASFTQASDCATTSARDARSRAVSASAAATRSTHSVSIRESDSRRLLSHADLTASSSSACLFAFDSNVRSELFKASLSDPISASWVCRILAISAVCAVANAAL